MIVMILFFAIAGVVVLDSVYRLLYPPSTVIVYTPAYSVAPDFRPVGCGVLVVLFWMLVFALILELWL